MLNIDRSLSKIYKSRTKNILNICSFYSDESMEQKDPGLGIQLIIGSNSSVTQGYKTFSSNDNLNSGLIQQVNTFDHTLKKLLELSIISFFLDMYVD